MVTIEAYEWEYISTFKTAFNGAIGQIGYNYYSPGWVALYVFLGLVVGFNLIFAIYKFALEMSVKKSDKILDNGQFQYGYKFDPLGFLSGVLFVLCTFLWHFLCIFCCLDYYRLLCHWASHEPGGGAPSSWGLAYQVCMVNPRLKTPSGRSYYESSYLWFDNSYRDYKSGSAEVFGWTTDWWGALEGENRIYVVFICFLCVGLVWNLFFCVVKDKLQSYYMLRVPMEKAGYVLFWKKKEEPVHMMSYDGFLRMWLDAMNKINQELLGNAGVSELAAVTKDKTLTANLLQHFYNKEAKVYETKALAEELKKEQKTQEAMHAECGNGLKSADVGERTVQYGSNIINIKMNSLLYDIFYEWFNALIMYEFFFLYIWWLWSYFMPGLFQSIIVVGSLSIKVYVQRKSKSQVQQMARGGQLDAEMGLGKFIGLFLLVAIGVICTFANPFGFRVFITLLVMALVFGPIYSILASTLNKQVPSMYLGGPGLLAICTAVSAGSGTAGGHIVAIILAVLTLLSVVGVVFASPAQKDSTPAVSVMRNGTWADVKAGELVPGDKFELPKGAVPCDAFLIQGSCVCDESMLTGEATPVPKVAIAKDASKFQGFDGTGSRNMVSAGTECQVSEGPGEQGGAVAVVMSTGAATRKGAMITEILTPQPVSFVYQEHLIFLYVLLFAESIIVFIFTGYFQNWQHTSGWLYGTFTISQIVSPLLPACLVWALSSASARLGSDRGILCTNLERINMLGKVKIFCFDKTGTLTQQGLDFFGCKPVKQDGTNSKLTFLDLDETSMSISEHFKFGLASCHTVDQDAKGNYIGNPVDIKLFEQGAKGWSLQKQPPPLLGAVTNQSMNTTLEYKKKFPFDHSKMLSSVIVENKDTTLTHAYIKGSFEAIANVCTSVPDNYKAETASLAKQGYYVLAMGKKDMSHIKGKTSEVMRHEVESDVELMGLMIFRNELKPDTAAAMTEIIAGDMRPVMITGDNALTGVHIARSCGMIEPGSKVLLGEQGTGGGQWTNVDTGSIEKLATALKEVGPSNLELAITQGLYSELLDTHFKKPLPEQEITFQQLLPYIRIYGRMKPQGKISVVKQLMEFAVTAMCGDGGNDAGALRTAHAGLALSEAEASLVAPFSTANKSIMQCVALVKEGRCALATTFAAFRYLVFYGQTMGFLSLAQYYFGVVMSEAVWIYIDVFINVIMSQLVLWSGPAEKLAPRRPSAKIFGAHNIISSTSIVLMNLLFLVIAFFVLNEGEFYKCREFAPGDGQAPSQWWLLGDNYEAMTICFVVVFQFVNSGAIVNFGSDFRANSFCNRWLWFYYIGLMCCSLAMLISDANWLTCVFRVNCGDELWMIQEGLIKDSPPGEGPFAFDYFGFFGLEADTLPVSCNAANIGTSLPDRVTDLYPDGYPADASWFKNQYPDGCPPKALVWGNMYTYNNIYPLIHRYKMVLIVIANCVVNLAIEYGMLTIARDVYRAKNPRQTGKAALDQLSLDIGARAGGGGGGSTKPAAPQPKEEGTKASAES
jgi:predicted P-type ATPase